MSRDRTITAAIIGGLFAIFAAVIGAMLTKQVGDEKQAPPAAPAASLSVADGPVAPTEVASKEAEAEPAPAAPTPTAAPVPVTRTLDTKYDLDRTGVFVRLYDPTNLDRGAQLFIGFRNGSNVAIRYRFISAYLTLDGIPIPITSTPSDWWELRPAQNLGGEFQITNRGIEVRVGSILDVVYEIAIKAEGRATERRYERVRITVTAANPVRMEDREVFSRSTFLQE